MAKGEPAVAAGRSGSRTRPSRKGGASGSGPPELILQSKLRPPSRRSDSWIRRDRLLARLGDASDRQLVLLDAPVGYGKTVLLADWAASEAEDRAVAWLSLDPFDSDVNRFLVHLIAAVGRQFPEFGEGVVAALGAPDASASRVVSLLINELSEVPRPLLMLLDDYHTVRSDGVHEALAFLVERLPPTVRLAIATRTDPPIPLGRFRAAGQMLELRADELAFDEAEVETMLSASDIRLSPPALHDLVDRLEGWPAGTYLATISLRDEADPEGFVEGFTGSHRHIADYLTEEVLRRQPEDVRSFLARSSIFDRFSADVCDAVLERTDSRQVLDQLEHWNLFLVGLDDHREWYRYHHLFQELLAADLTRREPAAAVALHVSAGHWFASRGYIQEAIDHVLKGGDRTLAASLVSRHWRAFVSSGRLKSVQSWIDALGEDAVMADPAAALAAAWISALGGDSERLPGLLEAAENGSLDGTLPDGTASLESGVALIRGMFGFDGFDSMRASLRKAAELESKPGSPWIAYILAGLGLIELLLGNTEDARAKLTEGLRLVPQAEPLGRLALLAELSLVEGELGDSAEAMRLAGEARQIAQEAGLSDDPRTSLALLALGQALRERGELVAAEAHLERALALETSTRGNPLVNLQVLLALAPVKFALDDREGARRLLDRARGIVSALDGSGDLVGRIKRVERSIRASAHQLEFGQVLTERELAVLSLLPTKLNQRDIGRELFLSLNTVKSHTRAIYRKLGAASRSEAVAKARHLGLL